MDADNKSESGSDFERVEAGEEQQLDEEQQHESELSQDQDISADGDINAEGSTVDSSDMVAEQVREMQEEMTGLHVENGQFRKEVETMKTEKQVLLENISALSATVDSLQAQNGELLQVKQKVVELEAKQLAQNGSNSAREKVCLDQKHLQCGICWELYSNPARLPCGHSYCRQCLVDMANRNGQLECPRCQQRCRQPVSDLLTDYALKSMVEDVKRSNPLEQKQEFVIMAKDIEKNQVQLFNVTKRTTVDQLRQMVKKRTEFYPFMITGPGSKVLYSNDKTLEFYGIVSQCNMELLIRYDGGDLRMKIYQ